MTLFFACITSIKIRFGFHLCLNKDDAYQGLIQRKVCEAVCVDLHGHAPHKGGI